MEKYPPFYCLGGVILEKIYVVDCRIFSIMYIAWMSEKI